MERLSDLTIDQLEDRIEGEVLAIDRLITPLRDRIEVHMQSDLSRVMTANNHLSILTNAHAEKCLEQRQAASKEVHDAYHTMRQVAAFTAMLTTLPQIVRAILGDLGE